MSPPLKSEVDRMATKWTTITFIQAFLQGKLGRKRVHGTYRVLDGDHCKVLVRATTNYGRPSGNDLIAINLDTAKERVSFFHSHNTSCFTYRMNKVLDTYPSPKLPATVLNEADGELLASGVIDFNDNEMLIEIGDKPYLLYRKKGVKDAVVLWEGVNTFSELDAIPARAATISEAKELIKDPPGAVQLCGIWWAHKQPVGFQPPALDDSILKVLSGPVNPLEHGYKLEDCSIYAGGSPDCTIQTLVPYPELLDSSLDSRAKGYLDARDTWNETCNALTTRVPPEYKGLTIKKNRYSLNATRYERTGAILRTSEGVFVKGIITNKEDWDNKQKLDSWYKLDSKVNRIKL
ncbi:hypothetical protein LCGC14_0208060 [marine sediment metagenome]|uniref:Uncharacterized protein n=1 Tax=marine sediment metagenome TaxID=412755 RepID=A0A0F9UGI6_9ZZZZ